MDKNKFVEVVNAIVDARIKKIVPILVERKVSELKKQLLKEISEGTSTLPDDIEIPDLNSILSEDVVMPPKAKSQVASIPPAPKPIKKLFTKDPALNAILQQTAEEIRAGKTKPAADAEYMEQYKQILSEQYSKAQEDGENMETFQFDTSHMGDIVSKRSMMPPASSAVQDEISKKVSLEIGKKQIAAMTGNEELGGLIMRDYRSLMKAVDDKSKNKRG